MEQIKLARSKASNLLVPDDYDGSTYHAKLSRELAAVSRSGRFVDSTRPLQYTTFSVGGFLLKVLKTKPAIYWCFTTHRLLSLRESVIHVTRVPCYYCSFPASAARTSCRLCHQSDRGEKTPSRLAINGVSNLCIRRRESTICVCSNSVRRLVVSDRLCLKHLQQDIVPSDVMRHFQLISASYPRKDSY